MKEEHDCDGCELDGSRRAFLKDIALATAGVVATLGIPGHLAAMITPSVVAPRSYRGPKPVYPIPAADGVQIDKKNDVILVRWKNAVYAFNLSCPHQNTALRWEEKDGRFQCPKHHSKYQPDGTFIEGRATRNMDRFSVTRNGNDVVVDVDAMHKNDKDQAGWSGAVIKLP